MLRLILIFASFLFFFIAGCNTNEQHNKLPRIDIEKNVCNLDELQLSDYVDDLIYIPIKSCPVLLGRIRQVVFYKDFLAVRDLYNCIVINSKGQYITKIVNEGNGPGEYNLLGNIALGTDGKTYLQDRKSILVYNLKGEFIRKFKPEINSGESIVWEWSFYNDSLFLGIVPNNTGSEKFKAVIFNNHGKTLCTYNNYIKNNRNRLEISSTYTVGANIYKWENTTCFKSVANDTLFRINNKLLIEPIYCFNLGKYAQPISDQELTLTEMTNKMDNYIFVRNIYETASYIFLDCNFGNNSPAKRDKPKKKYNSISKYYTYSVLGIFDKSTYNVIFSKPKKIENHYLNTGLYNDIDGGLNFYPKKMVNDSTLAMWVDAFELKNYTTSDEFKNSTPKFPEKKKALEKLANSLNENDNPVLILAKLKK